MALLFDQLKTKSAAWRKQGFPHEEFSPIAEILEWASSPDGSGFQLRTPQLRALEMYWYLRLVEDTPKLFDLYQKLFPPDEDPEGLLKALGIPGAAFTASKFKFPLLWKNVRNNDEFVREHSLEALRETMLLQYPSYILALAMGAGKTALIGAIIATEFAMALEYPEGPFIQNALVFAPGTTILGSLRELAAIPYERILPPRLFKQFAATVKLIFTRDGEKDIPVIKGSSYNVVVTNTEKIRIQKETIRKSDLGTLFSSKQEDEARTEISNLRLQSIASLPHLGVFSDEAHHTYGQALDTELKKVRKTVNYLHDKSPNLVCVVNTTGTPYFKKQPLRDVVVWYGLSQGITDNILKPVADNIHAYDFEGDAKQFVAEVISDFFRKYRYVRLPDGSWSKLAIYFPQTDDLRELRPSVEAKLIELKLPADILFERHSDSTQAEKDAFERINDVNSPHRVILLVNMGTEGWNVPSLFACALARKLKTSNNFVLQAASRCLRQVPGNIHPASIYLSADNRQTLDKELQETYGESLEDLRQKQSNSRAAQIVLRKIKLPPLVIRQLVRTVTRKETGNGKINLTKPTANETAILTRTSFEIARQSAIRTLLKQAGETVVIETDPDSVDLYTAATELAAVYRLDEWTVLDELRRLYVSKDELPLSHLGELGKQIEAQTCQYEVKEEHVERALALIKPDGFDLAHDAEGNEIYTADIRYPIDREKLLAHYEAWKVKHGGKSAAFGFHYTPYNFDSNPELSFFEQLFGHVGLHPEQVEDIYFTGAITDPRKTDFFVEYLGEDNRWHRYTPDFIIRRKPDRGQKHGRCLIVEIKAERERRHPIDGEKGVKALAVRQWEQLNSDQLKYEMIFVREDVLANDRTRTTRQFVEE
jgi:type III restriction enzyme